MATLDAIGDVYACGACTKDFDNAITVDVFEVVVDGVEVWNEVVTVTNSSRLPEQFRP